MFKTLRKNPILIHQMRSVRWPSLRTAAWIAAALTVIGLALTITAYAVSPNGEYHPFLIAAGLILMVAPLLLVFGPLLTTVVAVIATRRAIDLEVYQMIRLSQMTDRDIITGYLAGALFRLRSLWMIFGGLVLPLIMAMTHNNVAVTVYWACFQTPLSECIPPKPSEIVLEEAGFALIVTLCFVVLFAALSWAAAALGFWAAFHQDKVDIALVWVLVPLLITLTLGYTLFTVIPSGFSFSDLPLILAVTGVAIVLGCPAYQRAVRCVRE